MQVGKKAGLQKGNKLCLHQCFKNQTEIQSQPNNKKVINS